MNRANLPLWLSALCVLLLAFSLWGLWQQQKEIGLLRQEIGALGVSVQSKIDQSEIATLARESNMTFNVVQQTASLQKDVKAAQDVMANRVSTLASSMASRLTSAEAIDAQLRDDLQKQRVERNAYFQSMSKRLDDLLVSGALFPDKSVPAAEAVKMAKAALATGDQNIAKIYLLSAVNHAPSVFNHLRDYSEIILQDKASTVEDLVRLKSVLQVSLYQIPPAGIGDALKLLERTVQKENDLLALQNPRPVPVDWRERFAQVVATNKLDESVGDLKRLGSRLESLNEIAESLREEQTDPDLRRNVEMEFELTQRVLTAARLSQTLDIVLRQLNDATTSQPEKAVSLLQTAEGMLGQLWGIDSAGFPAALRQKADQFPQAIQVQVERVAEAKSAPYLREIEQLLASAKSFRHGAAKNECQRALNHYDQCLQSAATVFDNITSTRLREKARTTIEKIRTLAVDARKKQFDAYQRWAVGACREAYDIFNGDKEGWFTQKWMNAFDETNLMFVDESKLAPETARLFSEIVQKFLGKMNGDGAFYKSKAMAEAKKKALEDF